MKIFTATVLMCLGFAATAYAQEPEHWGSYYGGREAFTQTTPQDVGLPGVIAADASNTSDYALRADGTVWAWGNGGAGQLGSGTKTFSTVPVQTMIPGPVVSIGEAKNEGAAVDSAGNGWVWGQGEGGSLCTPKRYFSAPINPPGLTGLVAVQGAEQHTLWLTAAGHVLACGSNEQGQLGLGEGVDRVEAPTEVPGLSGVVEVTAGAQTSAARTSTGQVYAWGNNFYGQVAAPESERRVWTPQLVTLPEPAASISLGGDTGYNGAALVLTVNHKLYAWGNNGSGQADPSAGPGALYEPVNTGLEFTKAVSGGAFSLGLDTAGNVWGWGSNAGGALGLGTIGGIYRTPMLIDKEVSAISATAQNVLPLSK